MTDTKLENMATPPVGPVVTYKSLEDHQREAEAAVDDARFALECAYGRQLMQVAVAGLDQVKLGDNLMGRGLDGRTQILVVLRQHAKSLSSRHGDLIRKHLIGLEKSAADGVHDLAIALAIALGRTLSDPAKLAKLDSKLAKATEDDIAWNQRGLEEGGIRAVRMHEIQQESKAVAMTAYSLETEIEGRQQAGVLADALVAENPWLDNNTEDPAT